MDFFSKKTNRTCTIIQVTRVGFSENCNHKSRVANPLSFDGKKSSKNSFLSRVKKPEARVNGLQCDQSLLLGKKCIFLMMTAIEIRLSFMFVKH